MLIRAFSSSSSSSLSEPPQPKLCLLHEHILYRQDTTPASAVSLSSVFSLRRRLPPPSSSYTTSTQVSLDEAETALADLGARAGGRGVLVVDTSARGSADATRLAELAGRLQGRGVHIARGSAWGPVGLEEKEGFAARLREDIVGEGCGMIGEMVIMGGEEEEEGMVEKEKEALRVAAEVQVVEGMGRVPILVVVGEREERRKRRKGARARVMRDVVRFLGEETKANMEKVLFACDLDIVDSLLIEFKEEDITLLKNLVIDFPDDLGDFGESYFLNSLLHLVKTVPSINLFLGGQPITSRTQLNHFGGGGYAYIFERFEEWSDAFNETSNKMTSITCENAVRILAWFVPAAPPPPPPLKMVACAFCGKQVKVTDAFSRLNLLFCSNQCLKLEKARSDDHQNQQGGGGGKGNQNKGSSSMGKFGVEVRSFQ